MKECKVGLLEKEPQYFSLEGKAGVFINMLQQYVIPRDEYINYLGRRRMLPPKQLQLHRPLSNALKEREITLLSCKCFISKDQLKMVKAVAETYPNDCQMQMQWIPWIS